jgi:RHS repeat-associated protein
MGSTADNLLTLVSEKDQRSMVIYKTEPEQVFNSMKTQSWFADVTDEALNKTTGITFPQLTDLLVNDNDFGTTLASFLIPKIQQDHFYLAEHHLYGSSRLGIKNYWPTHYEFSYNYGVNTNTWENEVSNNQLLSLHKPWYSQKLNALINSNQTEPYGNANSNAVVSNRIIGLKNYELTNHLGNVMAVISDKLVDSTTTNLVTDLLPLPSHRKTSLQAVYDYYPFGMLMPNRYAEDHTVQCLPISKNIYYTSWEPIHIAHLEDPATLSNFDVNPTGGGIDIQIEPGEQTLSVLSPSNQGQVVNLSQLITTGVEANKEVNLHVSINNRSADVVSISLQQLNTTTNQWEVFASTTVAREATIELKGTPLYNSAIKINFSANDMDMTISDLFTTRHDLLAGTELALICNGDNDFDKDYRFGFNGQEKDNEIKGIGNSLNYKYRMEETRLGRFFAVDPLAKKYPWYSSYQFAGNTPIWAKELEGLEPKYTSNDENQTVSGSDEGSDYLDTYQGDGNGGWNCTNSDLKKGGGATTKKENSTKNISLNNGIELQNKDFSLLKRPSSISAKMVAGATFYASVGNSGGGFRFKEFVVGGVEFNSNEIKVEGFTYNSSGDSKILRSGFEGGIFGSIGHNVMTLVDKNGIEQEIENNSVSYSFSIFYYESYSNKNTKTGDVVNGNAIGIRFKAAFGMGAEFDASKTFLEE